MAELALRHSARPTVVACLDVAERVILMVLFARMAIINYVPITHDGQWFNALVVFSEGLCAMLVMIRRKSDSVSVIPLDWLLAFCATAGPLLVQPGGGAPLVPPLVGIVLLFGGTGTQLAAKLILRRSFGLVPANRGVKIEGPYRLVRHPMYLGYVMVHIGFLLMAPNLLNLGIYLASFTVQIFRLLAEERLLMQDPAYVAFAQRVRYRLLPGVF
ncbi:isoprenylcysteine carboxylmethyltransferase family protein [Caulobacter sp. S45]|jgi:protein-S-isoprenylcysteine O-methyltransferase Ste14|uniref:methyltransferase family protein n=1 Tax=Caulobacter sp. S45 TaxID=1641861 RepID=UPI00131A6ADA|nr:isoprenylcysteine carboxylmethyltransferase family protein [Caulobacter sp. S45]